MSDQRRILSPRSARFSRQAATVSSSPALALNASSWPGVSRTETTWLRRRAAGRGFGPGLARLCRFLAAIKAGFYPGSG